MRGKASRTRWITASVEASDRGSDKLDKSSSRHLGSLLGPDLLRPRDREFRPRVSFIRSRTKLVFDKRLNYLIDNLCTFYSRASGNCRLLRRKHCEKRIGRGGRDFKPGYPGFRRGTILRCRCRPDISGTQPEVEGFP
jgi:hypothetical protein